MFDSSYDGIRGLASRHDVSRVYKLDASTGVQFVVNMVLHCIPCSALGDGFQLVVRSAPHRGAHKHADKAPDQLALITQVNAEINECEQLLFCVFIGYRLEERTFRAS